MKAQWVWDTFVETISPLALTVHQKLYTMANYPSSCCCLSGAAGCPMGLQADWRLADSDSLCSGWNSTFHIPSGGVRLLLQDQRQLANHHAEREFGWAHALLTACSNWRAVDTASWLACSALLQSMGVSWRLPLFLTNCNESNDFSALC